MIIELTDVDFSYYQRHGVEVPIFKSLSVTIEAGNISAIVGPSGCGKSTMLRLIAGLLKPRRGDILIHGKSAEQCRQEGAFGIVFQSPDLLPWRTVESNVRLPFELRGRALDNEAVQKTLRQVGLEAWGDQHPHQLSGGMQQRVALARALVARPSVLLLDEPFLHLDELLRFELLFHVQNHAITNGTTVVLVTHDLSEAVIAADVVYVLSERPVLNVDRINVPLARPRSLASANQQQFHKCVSQVRESLERMKSDA